MKFTEETFKKAFPGFLGSECFPHPVGVSLLDASKNDEASIENDLKSYLLMQ